jgi:hypothetical protein
MAYSTDYREDKSTPEPRPKPILVVKFPIESITRESHDATVKEVERAVNNEYHILLVRNFEGKEIEFQAFYEKDMADVKFEELKEIINESLK